MSMTSNSQKVDHNDATNIVNEINALLSELRKTNQSGSSSSQQGGNTNIVSEVNNLLTELQGTVSNLSADEVMDLAMKGGAKRGKKKSKSKSKSKSKPQQTKKSKSKSKSKKPKSKGKSKSKSKSRSQERSKKSKKGKSKSKSKSKPKSKSKSKSKKRSIKREEVAAEAPKRKENRFIIDLTALKAYIKSQLPNEDLRNMGAMTKVSAKLLKDNDRDVEKAKKAFKAAPFLKEYAEAKKESDAKKAAKKGATM